jgi:hypothetical protein
VFITADHGEALGPKSFEHGHTLAESVTRVPLVILGAMTLPEKIEQDIDLIDVGATIRRVADVAVPGTGRDLRAPLVPRPVWLGAPLYLTQARGVIVEGWLYTEEEDRSAIHRVSPWATELPPELKHSLPPYPEPRDGHTAPSDMESLRILGYAD